MLYALAGARHGQVEGMGRWRGMGWVKVVGLNNGCGLGGDDLLFCMAGAFAN